MTNPISTGPIQASTQGVVIVPDTLRAVLHERRGGNDGSIALASAGVAITIWITFATANFGSPITGAAFLLAGIGFSIATALFWFKHGTHAHLSSIDSIVEETLRRSSIKSTSVYQR